MAQGGAGLNQNMDLRVSEVKDGHDYKCDPWLQSMLNTMQRRLDHFAFLLQRMNGMVGLGGVGIVLLKLIEQPAALTKKFRLVDGAARRNGKGQQDTGNG